MKNLINPDKKNLINPDEKNFNIFKEINKIQRHIKKFLIDKIQIKSLNNKKGIKKSCYKTLYQITKNKNTIKNKKIKE